MHIVNFRRIEKEGSPLKASFLVVIPEWDFHLKMTYFAKGNGESWFGYPSKPYTNSSGEKKLEWLAYFGERGKNRFEEALRKEINKLMDESPPQQMMRWSEDKVPF